MAKQIPNILTTFRLFLIPVFAFFALNGNFVAAAVVFVVAGTTDVVDGYIARKLNAISDFGKVYDPLVDKLFQISAVVCLFIAGVLPDWIVYFIIFKEGTMLVVSTFLYIRKIVVYSHWYGKAATVIFYAAIGAMLITEDINPTLTFALLCTVVASALLSGFGYLFDFLVKRN